MACRSMSLVLWRCVWWRCGKAPCLSFIVACGEAAADGLLAAYVLLLRPYKFDIVMLGAGCSCPTNWLPRIMTKCGAVVESRLA